MADVDAILRDAEKRAASQFDRRPKAPVVARAFQRFRKPTPPRTTRPRHATVRGPGSSRSAAAGAPDQVQPALARLPRDRPGPPLSGGARAREHGPAAFPPDSRLRPDPAFGEGWGLYAERLAAESDGTTATRRDCSASSIPTLFRARRLVVDTGLHAKRWTRQQAIDYGIEASEVERYVVNPGQACAYMIGQLKIVELREKARAALGNRFSIREFHNVVLGTGSVPLDLLERQVDAYIARQQRPLARLSSFRRR